MGDLDIFAPLDPEALDRVCIEAIRQSPERGKVHLVKRIESKSGPWNREYAGQIGAGIRQYRLVEQK